MTRSLFTRRALCVIALAWLGLVNMAHAQEAPRVKFVTNLGEFVVEVYPDKAPKTVENFLQYVRDKHYDGTIFHRVIANFMVQGGGYDQRYMERQTRAPVVHEGLEALSKGGPRNTVGTIAMARTSVPNSATAQFFINVVDNAFLDPTPAQPGYTVFGKVVSGHGGGQPHSCHANRFGRAIWHRCAAQPHRDSISCDAVIFLFNLFRNFL
jgi:peptidyl-prolyl cis-trans isomerase A (cyclophilin A)